MSSRRKKLRVVVLSEDKRSERFFRKLLTRLAFRRFRFETAPKGKGSGEAWVLKRYPTEVRLLRTKNFQASLRLVAVRDADGACIANKKQQLNTALEQAGLCQRRDDEKIATPVPARNIETWLLALLGRADLDETKDYKPTFEQTHGSSEGAVLDNATAAWRGIGNKSLPSLRDGAAEMKRINP